MLSGGYQERFQAKSLRILVVTTSNQRRENLRRAIAAVGGGDRYWLTTFDQVTPMQVLTSPIWYKPGHDGQHTLLG